MKQRVGALAIASLIAAATVRCGTLDGGGDSPPPPQDAAVDSIVGDELAVDGDAPHETFVQVAAGAYQACALAASGAVYCWGANHLGAVGAPRLGSLLCESGSPCRLPTKVLGLAGKDIVEISVGAHISCARTRSGEVWCWGANDVRQLGSDTPTPVLGAYTDTPQIVPSLPTATALRSRNTGSCVVSDDASVLCWGTNDYADLGRASLVVTDAGDPGHLPGKVENLEAVSQIEIGPQNWVACAYTIATKRIACWGLNSLGVLGHDPNTLGDLKTKNSVPINPNPMPLNDGGTFDELLGVGAGFGCARAPGGVIGCWGVGNLGELGNGTFDAVNHPSPEPVMPPADYVRVRAGYAHACGIDSTGRVFCWGSNLRGELGDDEGVDLGGEYIARAKPAQVQGLPPIADVAPGFYYTLAIDMNGQLWSWGGSYYGQLGRLLDDALDKHCNHGPGDTPTRCNPTPARITIP